MGVQTCRWSLVGLIVLQPLWFFLLAPPQVIPAWLVVICTTLPLLALLPFVWRLGRDALVIGGCILLIYFCLAVAEAWASPAARLPALVQAVLVTAYMTAMSALRFGRKSKGTGPPKDRA